ncbi:hypothetical protein DPMN_192600 [Dreissena polymorpha]|uniref:Uncharacterized protein n=1 Tax=Dreissena polymorpha TaxID=45954 RepID=A0A9D4BGZ6_DREPO|nr:hypothetical protein DPMN_192600 [Dreissena polymorpha]
MSTTTIFNEDWTINVTLRVKNTPSPGDHVFQPSRHIFKLHADGTINVASSVLTRQMPLSWWPCSDQEKCPAKFLTIFEPVQDIIGTNLVTNFHEDWTINVASRLSTRKNAPPTVGHVFQLTATIFELVQDIIGKNLLTKFHDNRTINVASRVLTRKNAQSPEGHIFQQTGIIFELVQDIIATNLVTKFHDERTINGLQEKNAPPPGGHAFQPTGTIFKFVQDINGANLLTKFHDDRTINVASRPYDENAPPLGGHVFQPTETLFEFVQDIIGTNLLTYGLMVGRWLRDREPGVQMGTCGCILRQNVNGRLMTQKNAPPPGGHVFQPTGITFELFHEDRTINVASRLKNPPPPGGHVFQATILELVQVIVETNLLTKFHEDCTINVASIVFARQILTPHEDKSYHKSSI